MSYCMMRQNFLWGYLVWGYWVFPGFFFADHLHTPPRVL